MADIVVYNLQDDGTPVSATGDQASVYTDATASSPAASDAGSASSAAPSGSPASPITEGDVRNIVKSEMAQFRGDIRAGSLLSNQAFVLDSRGMSMGGTNFSSAPFSVTYDGYLSATSGTFSGAISASTIDIGGSDSTSFHVDADGNLWSGASSFSGAPFSVSNSGAVTGTSVTISGVTFNGSQLTSSGVEIVRGYNLSPSFNVDSQNGTSFAIPSGFSDDSTQTFTITAGAAGTSDTYNCLGFEISKDIGAAFYLRSDSGRLSATASMSSAGDGAIYIGTDSWYGNSGSSNVRKNGSLVTISGTARFGSYGHDPTNSYLLILYSSTKIARFSGISGTTITNANSDVTLDTAIDNNVGFLFDNTNSRYLCIDTTNNLIRRFNSSGTTIDTVSYTVSDANIVGLTILTGRVHLVLMKTTDVDNRSTYAFVDLVPTSMRI